MQTSFGESVAISADGSRIAVGAPDFGGDGETSGSGAVFVYTLDGDGRFALETRFDGFVERSRFGASVAVDGGLVVVGAPFDVDYLGAAYVYQLGRLSGAWVVTDRIEGGRVESGMGGSVAAFGGFVLVHENWWGRALLYTTLAE